jgi:FtsP/CotA-like multicopper oxidase with cupredoxin domain
VRLFRTGEFYDQHYPNVLAGVNSTHQDVGGDIQESMSTLWYHDHMHDFTSQNVYKGLAGMYLLFNDHDTGDETTGFHLPSFGDGVSDDSNFDVPMLFSDHLYDSRPASSPSTLSTSTACSATAFSSTARCSP